MINIGPTKEGIIAPIYEERLRQMGKWLNVSGDAIYKTTPWQYQNDTTNPNVWYTSKDDSVYAILLKWSNDFVKISAISKYKFSTIKLLGYDGMLKWTQTSDAVIIDTSGIKLNDLLRWAWAFEFKQVQKIKSKY